MHDALLSRIVQYIRDQYGAEAERPWAKAPAYIVFRHKDQKRMFCIAALLVGGASVERASIGNVFLGVTLFHLMFIVAPSAGAKITGDSMIGEYFRVFVSYGVITVALTMYETRKRKKQSRAGQLLQREQEAEAARNGEDAS